MDGVDALAACLLLEQFYQSFCHAIHAAYCRHHPYLVSYAHLAVLANVAFEGAVLVGDAKFFVHRVVGILQGTCEIGLQIVLVHPFASLQVYLCMTDRIAVFQDVGTCWCVLDEHLVSGRSILQQGDGLAIHLDSLALLHGAQANHYRVGRVNLDKA